MSIVTSQEHNENLVAAALHREMEIYQYQINIDNYKQMLDLLPQEDWPEEIAIYKAASIESLPHEMEEETVQLISDLQYRDRIRGLLRTEKVEQNKSIKVKEVLKAQIGEKYSELLLAKKQSNS